jgi:hypothetical protein
MNADSLEVQTVPVASAFPNARLTSNRHCSGAFVRDRILIIDACGLTMLRRY